MSADTAVSLPFATSSPLSVSMRAEIVADFGELTSLAAEWTQLWNDNPSATIFQTLPWQRAWWKAFGDRVQLCTPVIWRDDELVGILPLICDRATVRFLGVPGTDYCDILCREELAPTVLNAALKALLKMRGWRTCRLDNLRDDSQLLRHAGSLSTAICDRARIFPIMQRSTLLLDGCGNDVIAAVRRKSALKRHRNKLNRSGSVKFRHLEERVDAELWLATLFEQHIGRRGMLGEHSQFMSSAWRSFYSALVNELDPKKQLRFSVLELDGKPIACHFGFECRGSFTIYKPTFDPSFANLSPGNVLLDELLAYAGQHQLKEVDFTIGCESYKQHFTNHTSDMFVMVLDRGKFLSKVRGPFDRFAERIEGSSAVNVIKRRIVCDRRNFDRLRAKVTRSGLMNH